MAVMLSAIYRRIFLAFLVTGFSQAFYQACEAKEIKTYPESGVQVFLGLDDTSAPTQVADGRAQDIQNVSLDISRSARQRYGYSLIGGTLDEADEAFCPVTGIYYTKFSSGTERILSICSSRLYYLNGSVWTEISPPAITSGSNNQFVFTTALDNVIATNDVDAPFKYDGTSASSVSFSGLSASETPSAAKTVAFFKNYLIFGNTVENSVQRPTRIRYSNVGTIGTWSDDDFIDISALGGQEINAMAELYDNLYIFLTDSIFKISLVGGADVFQVSKVTDDIGCIAKNSVQSITLTNAQNGLVFLDKDKKVYFFNGVIAQDVSQLITTTMSALSGSRLQYAASSDTNKNYMLCVTTGSASTNNLCLDFQYEIGEWTKHTNMPANAMAHVLDSNSNDHVYFGSYHSYIYQAFNSDNRDDVASGTGTVSAVEFYETSTASSLQVLNTASQYTANAFVGAPVKLTSGTGSGQTSFIVENTTSGIVVADTLSPVPDSTTLFEIGAINSFYTTKWYDMAESARLKHFGEVYFWADADVSSTISISYATDFNADISTQAISLSSSSTDAIWGEAIWGVALWGSVDTIFRQVKMESQGRYLRVKWAEDDPGENWRIYGWIPVYWKGDVN